MAIIEMISGLMTSIWRRRKNPTINSLTIIKVLDLVAVIIRIGIRSPNIKRRIRLIRIWRKKRGLRKIKKGLLRIITTVVRKKITFTMAKDMNKKKMIKWISNTLSRITKQENMIWLIKNLLSRILSLKKMGHSL